MATINATQKVCCEQDAREDERQHSKPNCCGLMPTRKGKRGSDAQRDIGGVGAGSHRGAR